MKITRRKLAVSALIPLAGAAPAAAAQSAETPEQLLQNARQQTRRNGDTLAKAHVPIAVEPAFQFKP
jgi:dihydroxyacetone kinase